MTAAAQREAQALPRAGRALATFELCATLVWLMCWGLLELPGLGIALGLAAVGAALLALAAARIRRSSASGWVRVQAIVGLGVSTWLASAAAALALTGATHGAFAFGEAELIELALALVGIFALRLGLGSIVARDFVGPSGLPTRSLVRELAGMIFALSTGLVGVAASAVLHARSHDAVGSLGPLAQLAGVGLALVLTLALAAVVVAYLHRAVAEPLVRLSANIETLVATGDPEALASAPGSVSVELASVEAHLAAHLDQLRALIEASSSLAEGQGAVELSTERALERCLLTLEAGLERRAQALVSARAELDATGQRLAEVVQRQAERLAELDRASERTRAQTEALAAAADEAAIRAASLLEQARHSEVGVAVATKLTKALDRHTKTIAELLDSIAEVARRSDLLALNGALEASRAGEAGEGFALVAAEMAELALTVHRDLIVINERLDEAESIGAKTTSATERGRASASETVSLARELGEHSYGHSAELGETAASSASLATHVRALLDDSAELDGLVARLRARVDEVPAQSETSRPSSIAP